MLSCRRVVVAVVVVVVVVVAVFVVFVIVVVVVVVVAVVVIVVAVIVVVAVVVLVFVFVVAFWSCVSGTCVHESLDLSAYSLRRNFHSHIEVSLTLDALVPGGRV